MWSTEFRVRVRDCAPGGKARFSTIWDMCQDAAVEHAAVLNLSKEDMAKINAFWVLCRMKLEVFKFPEYGEKVRVCTAPEGVDRLYFMRGFSLYDAGGEVIARGMSSWSMIDVVSFRPVRIGREFDNLGGAYEGKKLVKLPSVGDDCAVGEVIEVRYGDIDVNNHVNNLRYVVWAENEVMSRGKGLRSMEVNYIAQTMLGERLELLHNEGMELIELRNEGGKTVFRARYADNKR